MGARGTILILVAGLAAILLSVATAILVSLRSGSADAELVLRDAQARIMLSAGIAYIQETSRLGWGGESYGWNDVRATSGSSFGGEVVDEHGIKGPLRADQFNLANTSSFPYPGRVARGDAFCWERPPGAISERFTPNPVVFRPDLRPGDDPDNWQKQGNVQMSNIISQFAEPLYENYTQLLAGNFTERWSNNPFSIATNATNRQGKVGGRDQQPLADTWTDFVSGQVNGAKNPRPETLGRGWFRVYRETKDEHNGTGTPWYNTIPLRGHGVFILAAGAGSTRGYRFWNASGKDYLNGDRSRSNLNNGNFDTEFAESSGLFQNEEAFLAQRANERILWYRLEWTAAVPGFDAWSEHAPPRDTPQDRHSPLSVFIHRTYTGSNPGYYPNFGGTIRWLMRLDKEPDRW